MNWSLFFSALAAIMPCLAAVGGVSWLLFKSHLDAIRSDIEAGQARQRADAEVSQAKLADVLYARINGTYVRSENQRIMNDTFSRDIAALQARDCVESRRLNDLREEIEHSQELQDKRIDKHDLDIGHLNASLARRGF